MLTECGLHLPTLSFQKLYKDFICIHSMAKDQVRLPSGMGGLVQYYDEYKSKIEFKPGTVVLFIILVILIEVLLHLYGNVIFS